MVGPAAMRSTATQPGSYGSWGAVWRSLRGWLPTLRSASLASSGEGAQLEFRSSLALAFDRVSASLVDAVRAHAHVALLWFAHHWVWGGAPEENVASTTIFTTFKNAYY